MSGISLPINLLFSYGDARMALDQYGLQWAPTEGAFVPSLVNLFANGESGFLFSKPGNTARLFQDVGASVPVEADMHPVGLVQFETPAGMAASQATSNKRPVWRANAGKPYLQFDGADDFLQASTRPGASGTIAAAFRLASSTSCIVMAGGTSTGDKRCRILFGSNGKPAVTINSPYTQLSDANLVGVDAQILLTWGAGGWQAYLDGVLAMDVATAINLDNTGAGFTLAALEGGTSGWFSGRIYGALHLSRKVSASEISFITNSFRSLYS